MKAELNMAVEKLTEAFGARLKTIVLFGSRARKQARPESDYDLFLVVDGLPRDPLERVKQVRTPLIGIPLNINTIAKTPEQVDASLTPLLLDICLDDICLAGHEYFTPYRTKALRSIEQAGLRPTFIGNERRWRFDSVPRKDWEITWEGYREIA